MRLSRICCACQLALSALGHAGAAEVMILGSFHFDNPGRDLVNVETDDVLTPKRQAEIQAVVDALAEFKPTKIAIELTPDREAEFNATYASWLRGDHELTRNEEPVPEMGRQTRFPRTSKA